jgi:proline dehydrogenase
MTKDSIKEFSDTKTAFETLSDAELNRAYALFKMVGHPRLVRLGGHMMTWAFRSKLPIGWAVKWSIFKQFCGGETLETCRPVIDSLRKRNTFAILDYGVEGEKSEEGFQNATDEIIRTSHEAKTNPSVAFVVFKFTAIARFELLEHVTAQFRDHEINRSRLSMADQKEWSLVQSRVDRIAEATLQCQKPLMIDAEETWIQGAIDAEAIRLMRLYNRQSVQVYTTYQMYRKDSLERIKAVYDLAKFEGFHVGVKLVRGAYIEKERARASDLGLPDPMQSTKKDTDTAYNEALKFMLSHTDIFAVCAGTHNEESSRLCLDWHKTATEHQRQRLWCSQLFGMSDHITFNLAKLKLNVVKYVPYGPVAKVLPYLIRRAEENTSVEGIAGRELQLIQDEIRRRKSKVQC